MQLGYLFLFDVHCCYCWPIVGLSLTRNNFFLLYSQLNYFHRCCSSVVGFYRMAYVVLVCVWLSLNLSRHGKLAGRRQSTGWKRRLIFFCCSAAPIFTISLHSHKQLPVESACTAREKRNEQLFVFANDLQQASTVSATLENLWNHYNLFLCNFPEDQN